MLLELQPKLLCARKSGSSSVWVAPDGPSNVRVVAATNQDLGQIVTKDAVLGRLVLPVERNSNLSGSVA